MSFLKKLAAATSFALCLSGANGAQVSYDFTWTGVSGYSMAGVFTAEDLNADNLISTGELILLKFEGFLNGASLGTTTATSSASGGTVYGFNFNLTNDTFARGRACPNGQCWNIDADTGTNFPGLGYVQGSFAAFLTTDGSILFGPLGEITENGSGYAYSATPIRNRVPVPATLFLVGAGLLALVISRHHRSAS